MTTIDTRAEMAPGTSTAPAFAWNAASSVEAVKRFGYTTPVDGLDHSQALNFDGFSAYLEAAMPADLPTGAFNVAAGVAVAAFPWNICPLLDALTLEEDGGEAGFQCAIDDRGTPRFSVVTSRGLHTVIGTKALTLGHWHRLVFAYAPNDSLSIHMDGIEIGRAGVSGSYRPPEAPNLLIGKTRHPIIPTGPIRPYAHLPITVYFDGLIDEIALFAGTLQRSGSKSAPAAHLPQRRLPAGPQGPGRFGATYEHLRYYDGWDRRWRVGDHPDVLVRFDHADYRVVFWRGTNYIPCWVTGNGIWYTNEFNETWGNGATGCAEPMSDKHCAYSHVRIIESSDARVVVHWRYALVDVFDVRPRRDPVSGWSDFSDEVYTIYPDGTATRSITLHSTQPMESHEFQESIVVLGPGQRPEDAYEIEPVTLANMAGDAHTYSWADGRPRRLPEPPGANIAMINTKSTERPYFILPPGPCLTRDDGERPSPLFPPYYHETLTDGAKFPWWNHWPTSDIPSDGRRAVAADRASHSSVLTGCEWADYKVTPTSRQRVMLHGLAPGAATELIPLARSWLSPAPIEASEGIAASRYDALEKAYVLAPKPDAPIVQFVVAASEASPLLNPAFIVENWGSRGVQLSIDGEPIEEGPKCRIGYRHSASGSDLIVWIEKTSTEPLRLMLMP